MCLAVPMKLIKINDFHGVAKIGDVKRDVNLMLVPDAKVGDYVITHAGLYKKLGLTQPVRLTS